MHLEYSFTASPYITYPFESPSYMMCVVRRNNLIFISTELLSMGHLVKLVV